jgi:periplasmic divalent cation tolerance protein
MTDKIVILSTASSEEEAGKLANLLVDRSLAACVNVLPRMRSYYRWKGAVESADEWMLVIKSSRALFGEVCTLLAKQHSYEVPEAIAVPILDGAANYLDWLEQNLEQR